MEENAVCDGGRLCLAGEVGFFFLFFGSFWGVCGRMLFF